MERFSDYDALAWLYNKYWAQAQRFWSPLDALVLKDVPAAGHILDLCCGTGQLAAALVASGFQVTGVDGSSEMLRFARENAPEADFVLTDARALDFPPTFHGAVSQTDALNHVMNIEELRSVFERVYTSLLPGGRFLFDLQMEEVFRVHWDGLSFGRSEKDHVFMVDATYEPERKLARFAVTMFFLRDERWERSDVVLAQRAYPEAEVCEALKASGFRTAQAFDARKDLGLDGTGRAFFLAEKS